MSPRLTFGTLLVSALGAGCVPEFDTDLSELSSPRVLAIASNPAEARAEQSIELTALVAVPEGSSAPRLDWTMCLARKPLTELGPVNQACLGPSDGSGDQVELGSNTTATATLDRDVCKLFGPLRPSPQGNEGAGRPADPDITGGFYQPFALHSGSRTTLGAVRIDCDLANADRDRAIEYRQRYRANENPRIAELSRDGDVLSEDGPPPTIVVRSRARLRVSWDDCSNDSRCGDGLCTAYEDKTSCAEDCGGELHGCTGAEPYVWYDRESERVESRREGISVAWYASRGHFEHEQTGLDERQAASQSYTENVYVADGKPGPATIWTVIRDTRGGQSWQIRHLELTP